MTYDLRRLRLAGLTHRLPHTNRPSEGPQNRAREDHPPCSLRLSYLALTGMVTLLRLLPMSNADKDIEILALRYQLAVL
jgi:hypothetical protein